MSLPDGQPTLTALSEDPSSDPTLTYVAVSDATAATLPPPDSRPESRLPTWAAEAGSAHAATPARGPAAQPEYRFLRPIGRGGMGEVWEALQISLGRVVAVKRVAPGRAQREAQRGEETPRSVLEFRREALVAARLEHPNIVPVHDQGLDAKGSPLLAMKRVHGQAWSDLIAADWADLSPEEFLARHLPILVDMVQAVDFAHSQGIVHRDLKPSQVMVGAFGEVLLMDWGLALFIGEPEDVHDAVRHEMPVRESSSNPAGTPAFMAPEQTTPSVDGISRATDVYLIGATLFLLLTGKPPHSCRSSLEAFTRAAGGAHPDPNETTPDRPMPGELVALCRTCLSPDPADRPASARAVLDTLNDYLSGASRRREAAAIADAVEQDAADLGDGYEKPVRLLGQLHRAETLAPGQARIAQLRDRLLLRHGRVALSQGDLHLARMQFESLADRDAASEGLREADKVEARRRRESRQRRIAMAATFVLLLVTAIGGTGFSVSLKEQRDIAQNERDAADAQRVRAEEAEDVAQSRLEAVERKTDALDSSRQGAQALASFMIEDLRTSLGEIERLDLLAEAAAQTLEYYRTLPFAELDTDGISDVLDGLYVLTTLLSDQGNLPLALEANALAAQYARVAWEANPNESSLVDYDLVLHQQRALIYIEQGDLASASEEYATMRAGARDALEMGNGVKRASFRMRLAKALGGLASISRATGSLDDSEELFGEAIAVLQESHLDDPPTLVSRRELSLQLNNLASLLSSRDRKDEGIDRLAQSNAILGELVSEDPENTKLLADYVATIQNLGAMRVERGDLAAGARDLSEAQQLLASLRELEPDNVNHIDRDATLCLYLGRLNKSLGNRDEFRRLMRRGASLFEDLSERNPTSAQYPRGAVVMRYTLANDLMNETYEYDEARSLLSRNVEVMEALVELDPSNINWVRDLANNRYRLGLCLMHAQQFDEVLEPAADALVFFNEARRFSTARPIDHEMAGAVCELIGDSHRHQEQYNLARDAYTSVFDIMREVQAVSEDEYFVRNEAATHMRIGWIDVEDGEYEAALERVALARSVQEANAPYSDEEAWNALMARVSTLEGAALQGLNRSAEAADVFEAAQAALMEILQSGGLEGVLTDELIDLIRCSRSLGEDVPAEWIEELERRSPPGGMP